MEFKTIILEKKGGIAILTLNRPQALNAVSEQMANELVTAVGDVADDDTVRVLVIKGAGRAFCAGGDFDYEKVRKGEIAIEDLKVWPEIEKQVKRGKIPPKPQRYVILGLQNLDKPTIAMVHGFAAGLGWDIASACDIRIGSPAARFTIGFTTAGVPPDSGGAWLLPRLIGVGKALEFIFTGDTCDAQEAHRIGLLNRLVSNEQLEEETMKLAQKIANGSPIAFRLSKLLVYKGLGMDLDTAICFAMACVNIATASEDFKEAIKSFAEKKMPVFKDR
jgi:enoyl-CoA hydratase/carnithine racemase